MKIYRVFEMRKLMLFVLIVVSSVGCTVNPIDNRYSKTFDSKYSKDKPEQLLHLSHITPSKAEKIQIRAYLAEVHPRTVGGLYSKAYLASEDGNTQLEQDYLNQMVSNFPDDPNTIHYQSYMGNLDENIAAVKHGISVAPSFLNYNFFIKLTDLYKQAEEKSRLEEVLKLIDGYESKLDDDVYVFDFARGSIYENMPDGKGIAQIFYSSALLKKGGILNPQLWQSYFDLKYTDGIVGGGNENDFEYGRAVVDAIEMLKASAAAPKARLQKNIVSHRLMKNLSVKLRDAGYKPSSEGFEMANEYYYTSEVVNEIRNDLVNEKMVHKLLTVLEEAEQKLPNNPDVLGLLASEYAYKKQYDKADSLFVRSIMNSHVYVDESYYAKKYSRYVLFPTFRAEKAIRLLKEVQAKYKEKSSKFYEVLAEANLYAGRYKDAKSNLDKLKVSLKNESSRFPSNLEAIINDYIKRESESDSDMDDSIPNIVATTSVYADWLSVSPDQKYFFANNGSNKYTEWDADDLSVVNKFEWPIMTADYAKILTRPVYSPDGRYVATAIEFKEQLGSVMLVYDLKERRFSSQLPMIKKTSSLAWSPDGKEIAIWNYGRIIKYDVARNKVIKQGEVKGQDGADIMLWTANGKYLALLERSSDGSIRIFNAQTLEQTHRLEQANWPHGLGVSADGKYVFSVDNRSTLHRWDTENKFAHKSIKIPVLGRLIKAHPTKSQIVINDWRGNNKLIAVDYDAMEIIATNPTGSAELRIHYINDGAKILAANFEVDRYEIYDSQTLELLKVYNGESAVATGGVHANRKLGQLYTWDQDGIHIWSVSTGKKLHSWNNNFQSVIVDSKDTGVLYALVKDDAEEVTHIIKYNTSDYSDELVGSPNFIVDKWSIDSQSVILSGKFFKPMDVGAINGAIVIVDREDKTYRDIKVDLVTDELKYPRLGGSRFVHVAISPDSKRIAVSTAWNDGWKRPETMSDITRIIDIDSSTVIASIEKVGALFFKDSEHLAISDGDTVSEKSNVYLLPTDKSVRTILGGADNALFGSDDLGRSIPESMNVGELGEGFSKQSVQGHESWPTVVTFPERNISVVISKENRIKFLNSKTNKLELTILAKRDNSWIAYLPSGEYTSSEKGMNKVYWEINGSKVSTEDVENQYKRDAFVEDRLKLVADQ